MFSALKEKLITERADDLASISKATGVDATKLCYAALTVLQSKPDLWTAVRANPQSFINAVMAAVEQGLDFSKPNECHLVAFASVIQLIRGYKGWLKLARRAPDVTDVDCFVIYEYATYERGRGEKQFVRYELPAFGKPLGPVMGFCAFAVNTSGRMKFEEMTVQEVWNHAKRYKPAGKGPFGNIIAKGPEDLNFIPYGLKTTIIRLCNRQLDLTSEIGQGFLEEFEPQAVEVAKTVQQTEEPMEVEAETIVTVLSMEGFAGLDIETVAVDDLQEYMEKYDGKIPREEMNAIAQSIYDRGEPV